MLNFIVSYLYQYNIIRIFFRLDGLPLSQPPAPVGTYWSKYVDNNLSNFFVHPSGPSLKKACTQRSEMDLLSRILRVAEHSRAVRMIIWKLHACQVRHFIHTWVLQLFLYVLAYMWPDLRKPDIIAHFSNYILLYFYNLHTQMYVLAKFQLHILKAFEVTALQSNSNRKIDLLAWGK